MKKEIVDDLVSLQKLNKIYKFILDQIDVGIQVVDENGITVIYNKKKMDMESMSSEDVLNKNLFEIFSFDNKYDSRLLQALDGRTTTIKQKQTYYNHIGKEITTINNTLPIVDADQIIGAVEIAHDVTSFEKLKENILRKENGLLKGNTRYTFESIIGKSAAILEVIDNTKRATRTSSSVLIFGETGTGKELFAQSIHNGSERASAPFISQNCAALPDSLIESLLFGTKKGAFTGATDHPGLFEQAEGGTLLLDEINSLTPNLQAKLLRAIQEKSIRRVGDTKDKAIDVRIIATINEDPIDAIANNRLRKDLFYRLSVVSLFIPPLRDRKEDISLLVNKFVEKYNHLFQMEVAGVDEEVFELFSQYQWPGNIRELEHIIEGSMNLIFDGDQISYHHLPAHFINKSHLKKSASLNENYEEFFDLDKGATKKLTDKMEEIEAYYIKKVLEKNNYNVSHTATELSVSRQSLQYRMRKFNIKTQ